MIESNVSSGSRIHLAKADEISPSDARKIRSLIRLRDRIHDRINHAKKENGIRISDQGESWKMRSSGDAYGLARRSFDSKKSGKLHREFGRATENLAEAVAATLGGLCARYGKTPDGSTLALAIDNRIVIVDGNGTRCDYVD